MLGAAASHALDDGRAEFGVSDLLASVADDEEAASAFAHFGVDIDAMRELIQRGGGPRIRLVDAPDRAGIGSAVTICRYASASRAAAPPGSSRPSCL